MRLLLINSNPAVSRLINLSAEKFGYEIEEFKGDDFDLNENFDVTIVDNEAVSDNSMLLLSESETLGEIIYVGPKDLPKPQYANHFLQKPFLPTDFIDLVKKIEKTSKIVDETEKEEKQDIEPVVDNKELEDSVEEDNVEALDLDDMDSLDLPMPDDNFAVYEEEKLKEKMDKLDELSSDEDFEEDSNEDFTSTDAEDQESELLEEPLLEGESESEEAEDIPEELKLDEEESAEEDSTAILDSEDIDEVKHLLEDDMAADDLSEDQKSEDESEDVKDIDDIFDIEEDAFASETNMEETTDDVLNQDEVLDELVQDSMELEEPEDILKEIESVEEDSSSEPEKMVEDLDIEKSEEIEEIASVSVEEKSSIDELVEEDMSELFGEQTPKNESESREVDVEGIKEELQTKIVRDVKKTLDKDEIREALKGLKVNISISFDEE